PRAALPRLHHPARRAVPPRVAGTRASSGSTWHLSPASLVQEAHVSNDNSAEARDSHAAAEDVANLGFVRPPFVYLTAILAGVVLVLSHPLRWLPAGTGSWIGVPLLGLAVVLFFASIRRFKAAGTPVPGNKPTTAIVRSGPYRFTRNPIYLAFSVLVL